jgi:predicted N-acetyltransferase YhbS
MPLLNRRQLIVPMAGLAVAGPAFAATARTAALAQEKNQDARIDANGLQLRPYREADASAIEALVRTSYGSDPDWLSTFLSLHRPNPSARRWRTLLVAEQAGTVVAVASAAEVLAHDVANANVIVHEKWRRRGIGKSLVDRLRAQAAAEARMPLMTSIRPQHRVAYQFARACGMSLLMRSRRWVVDPSSWAMDAWCEKALRAQHGYRILEGAQVEPARLIEALGATYNRAHRGWIAVKAVTVEELSAYWSPVVVARSGLLVMEGDTVVGMGCLLDLQTGPLYISPIGTLEPIEPVSRELALTSHLLARCLRMARDLGRTELIIQRDDEDGRLMPLLADIPLVAVREGYALIDGNRASWPL